MDTERGFHLVFKPTMASFLDDSASPLGAPARGWFAERRVTYKMPDRQQVMKVEQDSLMVCTQIPLGQGTGRALLTCSKRVTQETPISPVLMGTEVYPSSWHRLVDIPTGEHEILFSSKQPGVDSTWGREGSRYFPWLQQHERIAMTTRISELAFPKQHTRRVIILGASGSI